MSAFGQGGGGNGGGAPGGGAPAGGGDPAANGQQQAGGGTQDPFGFASHVAGAPEHLRPMLQQAFDQIGPQLQQRFDRYSPLDPFMDQLAPLLENIPESETPMLAGLLELHRIANGGDETLEAFNDWWDAVGQSYGFFDDEDDGTDDGTDVVPPEGESELDQVRRELAETRAQLDEFRTSTEQEKLTQQQREAQAAATQRITSELQQIMSRAGIEGAEKIDSPASQDILTLALKYNGAPDAIEKATLDYLRINGKGAADLTGGAGGQDLTGPEALAAALQSAGAQVGPTLTGGQPASTKTEFTDFSREAHNAALQRMRASQPGG